MSSLHPSDRQWMAGIRSAGRKPPVHHEVGQAPAQADNGHIVTLRRFSFPLLLYPNSTAVTNFLSASEYGVTLCAVRLRSPWIAICYQHSHVSSTHARAHVLWSVIHSHTIMVMLLTCPVIADLANYRWIVHLVNCRPLISPGGLVLLLIVLWWIVRTPAEYFSSKSC